MSLNPYLREKGRQEGKAGGIRGAQRPEMSSSVEKRARVASPRGVDPSRMFGATSRFRLATRLVQHDSFVRVTPPRLSADTWAASDIDERWSALIGAASKSHSTDIDSLPHFGKPCGTLRSMLRACVRQQSCVPAGRRTRCMNEYSDLDGVDVIPAAASCCLPFFWRLSPSLGVARRQ